MFALDAEWGLVYVLAEAMKVLIGLNIGGSASAGGASMVAARREHLRLQREPEAVRLRFKLLVLALRWADDLLIAYRRSTRLLFPDLLRDLTAPNFYGDDLRLLRMPKNAAFGYRVSFDSDSVIQLRNALNFILDADQHLYGNWDLTTTTFHGGPQWRSKRLQSGVIRGHLLRTSVNAGLDKGQVTEIVVRTALEMIAVGMPVPTVQHATLRVARERFLLYRKVKKVLAYPKSKQKEWAAIFDELERRCRIVEATYVRLWMLENS